MIDPLHVERLQGARILLAENQTVIALDLEIMLRQLGCLVSRISGSVVETLPALEWERPDVVILNPRLNDGSTLPVAEALQQRQIPFILVQRSRRERQFAHPAWDQALHLEWPYGSSRLGHVLLLAMARAAPPHARSPRLAEA
jgi:DNA-binding NtrC family response regulator